MCDVAVMGLLDAAHLRPYRDKGSNDERNGIVFCATHHRAFDKRLFAIDPSSFTIVFAAGIAAPGELGIMRDSIQHLPALPHRSALVWCWEKFTQT